MIDPATFRALVSGQRRDPLAAGLRWVLWGVSLIYAGVMRLRNAAYDHGLLRVERVEAPVVCVGNLTLGGTGKTPLVVWLARWLRARDIRVAIVSRGYGAEKGSVNDEALELEHRLPDVPHVQGRRRVEAARLAIDELGAQLILMDDGFQHRRLARDIDLVLIDATNPWGYGHVFPRGLLREPLAGLRRAAALVLSRAEHLPPEGRVGVQAAAERWAGAKVWLETTHQPQCLLAADGATRPLATLPRTRVAAFCGIGNPPAFRQTLESCGCQVVAWREFADHYNYSRDDLNQLADWADQADADLVICTHKDLVKVGLPRLGRHALWALIIEIEFLGSCVALENLLAPLLDRARAIEIPDA